MWLIKNFSIDLYIKNNEEEFKYENVTCKYKNNKYIFKIDEDEYEIEKTNKVVFRKENSESLMDFVFENNKETIGTYYIKDIDFYIDAFIKTLEYDVSDKKIEIEYNLCLQDEEIGNFIFKLKVKE